MINAPNVILQQPSRRYHFREYYPAGLAALLAIIFLIYSLVSIDNLRLRA